ncbi:hypothetical protein [Arthrobacter sp. CJ23]|nr:hypothetical protein [Arthrobacter sp. CJ23]UVJ38928.1 hypothetical protein NVV90_17195 [Arthrobacter sp. CJ23]
MEIQAKTPSNGGPAELLFTGEAGPETEGGNHLSEAEYGGNQEA